MICKLQSQTYGTLDFQNGVPASLSKLLVPGSRPYYAEGVYGKILVQEIIASPIRLYYMFSRLREDVAINFTNPRPSLLTLIALKNERSYEVNEDSVHMKEGQFNMIRAASLEGTVCMERGDEYRTLVINYPEKDLLNLFPFLDD